MERVLASSFGRSPALVMQSIFPLEASGKHGLESQFRLMHALRTRNIGVRRKILGFNSSFWKCKQKFFIYRVLYCHVQSPVSTNINFLPLQMEVHSCTITSHSHRLAFSPVANEIGNRIFNFITHCCHRSPSTARKRHFRDTQLKTTPNGRQNSRKIHFLRLSKNAKFSLFFFPFRLSFSVH